jgi:uncharacterized membrane protein
MGSVGRIGDDLVVRGPAPMQIVRPDARSARLVRLRVWLASAMWFPVLAANLIAIALGVTLPFLDEILGDEPRLPIGLSAVETLLGGLAAGMITFTGIVFSAVLVADQLETTSYSPRLAARLRRDPVVIAGLALPTATASYSLFALAAVGHQANRSGDEIASALTVGVALVLVFLTFAGFVTLVQRTLDSAQIGGILRTVLRRTHRVIRDVHPIGAGTGELPPAVSEGEPVVEVSHPGPPGVLAAVDRAALVRLALHSDAFVEVVPMVGNTSLRGPSCCAFTAGRVRPREAWPGASWCWPGSERPIRTPRSDCACWWTSRYGRFRHPPMTRPRPCRRSTESRRS